MKRKWTKNLGLKILSLGIGALIWFFIINIDDPAITRTFRLSVEKRNEDAIINQGMCYDVVEGDAVTITVKGKRSIVENLTSSDFNAYADLSKLSRWNAVPIKVTLVKYIREADTPSITLGAVDTMIVSLEQTVTKQYKVIVDQKGTVEEGYCIGELKAKPNIIQVTGAKSQVSRIKDVRVTVDVSNVSENFETSGKPKVYDEDGKEINSSKMTFSKENIKVTGILLNTKVVPVDIKVEGEPSLGYRYTKTEYEPKSVVIAGSLNILRTVGRIEIPVDISGANGDMETDIDLNNYLPEGVMVAGENGSVMLHIFIEKLAVQEITFNIRDIQFKNLSNQLKFNFSSELVAENLTVKVMGLEEELKEVTIADLAPVINLEGKNKAGNYVIGIDFSPIEGIKVMNNPTVSIELTSVDSKPSDNETNTPNLEPFNPEAPNVPNTPETDEETDDITD